MERTPPLASALRSLQGVGELFVQIDRALQRFFPVTEVQALVLRAGVRARIPDADGKRGHAGELVGGRLDERDRSAAADRHRVFSVTLLQRAEARLECLVRGVGVPPPNRLLRL